jgi:hypothetical protein
MAVFLRVGKQPLMIIPNVRERLEQDYLRDPSDRSFDLLLDYGRSDNTYSIPTFLLGIPGSTGIPRIKLVCHLCLAFASAGRFLEAQHFCNEWRQTDPTSIPSWRMMAIIAAKRCDFQGIRNACKKLSELNAPENIQYMALTLLSLLFLNGRQAELFASEMLLRGKAEPYFAIVASDAVIATGSVALLSISLEVLGNSMTFSKRSQVKVKTLIVSRLLQLLRKHLDTLRVS